MKRILKSFTAMAVAIMMVFALTTTAFASASSGNIDVDVDLSDYTYSVTVPANATFSINPYGVGDQVIDENNVTGPAVDISNSTADFGVRVIMEFEVASGGDLLVDSQSTKLGSELATDKAIYIAVVGAATDGGAPGTPADYEFDISDSSTVFDFDVTSKKAKIEFALEKGTGAVTSSRVAAFTFYGKVGGVDEWDPGDIGITVNYTLRPMNNTVYAEASTVGLNIMGSGIGFPSVIAGITGVTASYNDSSKTLTVTVGDGYNATTGPAFTIPFNADGKTVTLQQLSGTTWGALPADRGGYSNNVITVSATRMRQVRGWTAGVEGSFRVQHDGVNYTVILIRG